jgi:hypothetical protein
MLEYVIFFKKAGDNYADSAKMLNHEDGRTDTQKLNEGTNAW